MISFSTLKRLKRVGALTLMSALFLNAPGVIPVAQAKTLEFGSRVETPDAAPRVLPSVPEAEGGVELLQAVSRLQDGSFDEAVALAFGVTMRFPESAEAWHILGVALANLERFDESIDALDKANAFYEENAEPLLIKGDLLLSQEDRAGAREAYQAAVSKDPSNWRAGEALGVLLEEDGTLPEAISHYEGLLANTPADRLFPRLRLAGLYLRDNRSADATQVLNDFLETSPEDVRALKVLGAIELAADKPREAILTLGRAVAAGPEDPALRLQLAEAHAQAGDFATATDILTQAFEDFPENLEIARNHGRLLGAQRAYDEAIDVFQAGLVSHPEDVDLNKGLSLALYQVRRFEDALPPAIKLAKREGATAGDHVWLGTVGEALENTEGAIAAYEMALRIEPRTWVAANNLALLVADRDMPRAIALAETAAGVAGQVPAVRNTLATIYLQADRAADAVEIFAELEAEDSENPVWIFRHGQALIANGADAEGRMKIERALSLDPDFSLATEAKEILAQ